MVRFFRTNTTEHLLSLLRAGQELSLSQQVKLVILLSIPAILAQISHVAMEYIDASMVGSLGADASASVGIVSTSTWMIWGLCNCAASGFSVQVAHLVGARNNHAARSVVRQGLVTTLIFSLVISSIALSVSGGLPHWLGGGDEICTDATDYFRIVSLCLPVSQMGMLSMGVLRSSGNILVPSLGNIALCLLDVIFNFLFIYPTRAVEICDLEILIPGAGLGVRGAALGTATSEVVMCSFLLWFLFRRSSTLRLCNEHGSFRPHKACLVRAAKISFPMGLQHLVMTSAQVVGTSIVAPLGKMSIAANSFGVTAESICYMPGFGVADAAQTLVGQSLGAGRKPLMHNFARVSVGLGMVVMTVMGALMYAGAPFMMSLLTPVDEIRALGVEALRIEAFAEPLFAASIVGYGVFVGAGDTLKPCIMNLFSMWAVRLSLAYMLAPRMGLAGVWTAMCIEICFRGLIFLARLKWGNWDKGVDKK